MGRLCAGQREDHRDGAALRRGRQRLQQDQAVAGGPGGQAQAAGFQNQADRSQHPEGRAQRQDQCHARRAPALQQRSVGRQDRQGRPKGKGHPQGSQGIGRRCHRRRPQECRYAGVRLEVQAPAGGRQGGPGGRAEDPGRVQARNEQSHGYAGGDAPRHAGPSGQQDRAESPAQFPFRHAPGQLQPRRSPT